MSERKKILLADDDAAFREINRIILESNGYLVDEADSADAALRKLKSEHFDLLVLDLMMEDRDSGFRVAYALKEDQNLKELPILMLTSAPQKTGFNFRFSEDKDWMKVDSYATKPLDPRELLDRVHKLLK
ncbi:response regulator [candidate division KSB1 bacterium]|nr:response regulator [candidate division KSB1 bacterium]